MKSLSKLFRIGLGPSSSHTIAPSIAAACFRRFLDEDNSVEVEVTFYGSLAATGIGHHSDRAVKEALLPFSSHIVFDPHTHVDHPLTMGFSAVLKDGTKINKTYVSLGGGEVSSPDDQEANEGDIYPFKNLKEIISFMRKEGIKTWKEFCLRYEKEDIDDYLKDALRHMFSCIEKGLSSKADIPANGNPRLHWKRSAGAIYQRAQTIEDLDAKREILLTAYAYAVAESSASGEDIVTAPTCGSSGVLPAILYYEYHDLGKPFDEVKDALYGAGIFGNIVKQNASIAGAIGGCQAEIGTASSMAAAAFCELSGLKIREQEYAAECAMEHFLGLSCDPVDGYVIIPCIERNGMGALRAYDAYLYARYISPIRMNMVSFDDVVGAMKLTGDALTSAYKETAEGGLAKILKEGK
ncbi:MAG: L-serine ammonia-lyase, iron-sulfur-dependent, subunit alpha [Bacilli bacterium]|nr:L-serine ammonia-lyase, iron-sulfur-dependent, subunit alpha [Bacilli bacterium]